MVAVTLLVAVAPRAAADRRVAPAATVRNGVNVYKAAGSRKRIGRIKKRQTATLIKRGKTWHKVRLTNKKVGYVAARWTRIVGGATADATASGPLTITFVDVGQGDAILLQVGAVDLLVDAGTSGAWKGNLGVALKDITGPLEALFITHPHDDHYGSAADVLANKDVQVVYTNGERRGPPRDDNSKPTWDAFEDAVKAEGLVISTLNVGAVLTPADGLTITVLATGSASGGEFPDTSSGVDINDDSLVLLVEYAGKRLLLTGDIENDADELLVKRHCENGSSSTCPNLHADVLKVPHHASASFEVDLFEAVGATWAVVSAGYHNAKHHLPRTEPIDALRGIGTKIISTSADGAENVVMTISDQGGISWMMPGTEFFAWQKSGSTYSEVTYDQGQ